MIRHASFVAVCAALCAAGCSRDPAQTSRAYVASGDRYAQQGKYPEAAIEYRNAIKVEPASADAHAKLADVLWTSQDTKRALDEWIRVAELQPDDEAAQVRAASICLLGGRIADATSHAYAAVRLDRRDPRALMALGEALAAAGEPRDSVERLREAVRLAPQAVPARLALAMVLDAASRRAEAQREYEWILAQHPAQAIAANNLAWIYLDEGRLDEALGDAVVAKAGLGRAPEVNDTLGWVYYKRHQPKLAVPLLTASVQARPDNALYRSHLDAARRALLSR